MIRLACLLALLLCTSGCESLWGRFNRPHLGDGGDGSAAQRDGSGGDLAAGPPTELDVLFVIDNSPGMYKKQLLLLQNAARFIREVDELGLDYHIGVVSTDVGSYPSATSPFTPDPNRNYYCQSFAGDDGALQHTACTVSGRLSAEALPTCQQVCPDSNYVPSGNYIAKTGGVSNVPQHISQVDGGAPYDDGPFLAFQCLAMVGDMGCEIPGPFEAAKRALDGHSTANAGFLRPGSILALIFLTDQDDCSVAAAQRSQNDPTSMDCPSPGANPAYTCYNAAYRCIAQDLSCNEPLDTAGTKTDCMERTTSYLEPESTYASFLQTLRTPHRLVVGGIWSPVLGGRTRSSWPTRSTPVPTGWIAVSAGTPAGAPVGRSDLRPWRAAQAVHR